MCQRYVIPDQTSAEREFLPVTAWWKFAPKFNAAPAQYVPAIRLHEGQTEAVMLRWGLIPSWFEGEPAGPPHGAVRTERMERSNLYRGSWLQGQRCILPAAGFYVWQLTTEHYRQPYFVRLTDRSVFGIAALWDRWVSEDDDVIESCAMLAVPGNELMTQIGASDAAMPAILRRRDYSTWLHGSNVAAKAALHSYKPEWMEAYPVSPRINVVGADDPDLIRIAS
jgi:putative SOS response-associated peptidase YedK